jgi:hypothetical protein
MKIFFGQFIIASKGFSSLPLARYSFEKRKVLLPLVTFFAHCGSTVQLPAVAFFHLRSVFGCETGTCHFTQAVAGFQADTMQISCMTSQYQEVILFVSIYKNKKH